MGVLHICTVYTHDPWVLGERASVGLASPTRHRRSTMKDAGIIDKGIAGSKGIIQLAFGLTAVGGGKFMVHG